MAHSRASPGTSAGPKVAFAPTTWKAGRSPFGRMGRTLDEVWASSRRTEQPRVDARVGEQGEEHVARGVRADRAGAPHLCAELGQGERRPAGGAGRRQLDLLDERRALTLRDRLDGADQHVQYVHAGGDGAHGVAHGRRPAGSIRSRARSRPLRRPGAAPRRGRAARRWLPRASRRCTPTRGAQSRRPRSRGPGRGRGRRGWPSAPPRGSPERRAPPRRARACRTSRTARPAPCRQAGASSSGRTGPRRARTRARSPSARGCGPPRRRRSARRRPGGGRPRTSGRGCRRASSPSRPMTLTSPGSSSARTPPVGVTATASPDRSADVAGRSEDQSLRGQVPRRGRNLLALGFKHGRTLAAQPARGPAGRRRYCAM